MGRWGERVINRRAFVRGAALGLGLSPVLRALSASAGVEEDEAPALPDIPVWIPPNLGAGERWVAVNLTEQATVAMRGQSAVHVAWATTGADQWETPEGEFRIVRRVYNETMTSAALGIPPGPDSYHLNDVLFTQYFTNVGHALHLNYWRPERVFGRERTSHGCVGLRFADAELLWRHVGLGSRVVIHA